MRTTLPDLAKRFASMPFTFEACVVKELKRVGSHVRDTVVRKFGHYQPAIGPYPSWPTLADSTLAQKQRAGATSDDPLIGHYPGKRHTIWPVPLRTTYESDVEGLRVNVGTADPLGPLHEFGTDHMPPRPVLRPAAFENEGYFQERMQAATEEAIRLL